MIKRAHEGRKYTSFLMLFNFINPEITFIKPAIEKSEFIKYISQALAVALYNVLRNHTPRMTTSLLLTFVSKDPGNEVAYNL